MSKLSLTPGLKITRKNLLTRVGLPDSNAYKMQWDNFDRLTKFQEPDTVAAGYEYDFNYGDTLLNWTSFVPVDNTLSTMARLARVIVPDEPHYINQRGNRRQPTFFCESDYAAYLDLLSESCAQFSV